VHSEAIKGRRRGNKGKSIAENSAKEAEGEEKRKRSIIWDRLEQ